MSTTFEDSIIISLCWCNNCTKLVTLETPRPQQDSSSSTSSSSIVRRCPSCNIVGSIDKITREQLSPSLLRDRRSNIFLPNHENIPSPEIYIPRPTSNDNTQGKFDCYCDDGSGSGFTLSPSVLLSTLDEEFIDSYLTLFQKFDEPKAATELIPTIEIQESHVSRNPDCSVCLEPFALKTKAKEMPVCKHLYHSDCILPWMASHVSCPLCRRQLSSDDEEEVAGLVVWSLPDDVYVLGRYTGGERLFKVLFTEEEEEDDDDPNMF